MGGKVETVESGYRTVAEVLVHAFIIPKYQRGYRWKDKHVKVFIEDIFENRLCDNPVTDKYCIQPLVVGVRKDENGKTVHDVIDGQQRLTTIYILLKALKDFGCSNIKLPDISYQSRFNNLANIKNSEAEENIELLYMNWAYDTICKELTRLNPEQKPELFSKMYDILMNEVQFIWHEINVDAGEEQVAHDEEQKIFDNINSGKISLTNAELIKAIFMNPEYYGIRNAEKDSSIKDRQILISELWDIMENELHDPYFWLFLPHVEQYEETSEAYADTRIDVLFEYLLYRKKKRACDSAGVYEMKQKLDKKDSEDDEYYVYEEIKTWVEHELEKGMENAEEPRTVMERCWDEVCDVFYGLKELFADNQLFNLTSLYVFYSNRKEKTSDTMVSSSDKSDALEIYWNLYSNVILCNREQREKKLISMIRSNLFGSGSIDTIVKGMRKPNVKDRMVDVLLAYNIAILNINKRKDGTEKKGLEDRYNFRRHRQLQWEKEHIFAQSEKYLEDNPDPKKQETVDKARKALAALFATETLEDNDYCKYVNYLHSKKDNSLPKTLAKEGEDKTEYEFADFDEGRVQNFIADNATGSGYQGDFVKAIRMRRDSKRILKYYESIELLESIIAAKEFKTEKLREFLSEHDISRKDEDGLDIINIDRIVEKELMQFVKVESDVVIFGKKFALPEGFWTSFDKTKSVKEYLFEEGENGKSNLEYAQENLWKKFSEYIRNNFYADYETGEELKKELPEDIDYDEICRCVIDTMRTSISDFFCKKKSSVEGGKKEKGTYTALLHDDSFGNITLLTGGAKGNSDEVINQSIGDDSFSEKRKDIFELLEAGYFLPMSTIYVFSGRFNQLGTSTDQWLIKERRAYLENLIQVLKAYYV